MYIHFDVNTLDNERVVLGIDVDTDGTISYRVFSEDKFQTSIDICTFLCTVSHVIDAIETRYGKFSPEDIIPTVYRYGTFDDSNDRVMDDFVVYETREVGRTVVVNNSRTLYSVSFTEAGSMSLGEFYGIKETLSSAEQKTECAKPVMSKSILGRPINPADVEFEKIMRTII